MGFLSTTLKSHLVIVAMLLHVTAFIAIGCKEDGIFELEDSNTGVHFNECIENFCIPVVHYNLHLLSSWKQFPHLDLLVSPNLQHGGEPRVTFENQDGGLSIHEVEKFLSKLTSIYRCSRHHREII